MKHPILAGNAYRYYIMIWAIIGMAHFLMLYNYIQLSITSAFLDSLIFNLIFLGLGLGFWYIIRFAQPNKGDYFGLFLTHTFGAAVAVGFWLLIAQFVLKFFLVQDTDYIDFLKDSWLWRGALGVLFYTVIVLIYYLDQGYQILRDKSEQEMQLKSTIKETELMLLKSQLNPHFIFNSLNSISSLTLTAPSKARDMVIKLSDFLRYSLGKDNHQKTTLAEELKNISIYLEIEKIRFGDKLIFIDDVEEESLKLLVPNMILQPLFENAIKHGVYESIDTVTIRLTCQILTGQLKLKIVNNFDADAVSQKGEGIGLKNIRQRLALIYGAGDLLQVDHRQNLFTVTLNIPIP